MISKYHGEVIAILVHPLKYHKVPVLLELSDLVLIGSQNLSMQTQYRQVFAKPMLQEVSFWHLNKGWHIRG